MTVALNGKTVVAGQIAGSVSRNPVFGFKVKGAKAGDKIAVSWADNKGDKRTDETTVA
jgi:sulfur-oxidizing protein SoxZ